MSNASSTFLRGANAGGKAADIPPTEDAVLVAVGTGQATDIPTLANALGVTLQAVNPVVDSMAMSGLLDTSNGNLRLTEAGQRALRYSSLGKA